MKKLYIAIIILTASITSFAQIKVGADIYSRYLWRGIDFGDAPAFQPNLSNDPDNSTYIQVGYPVAVSEATVTFAAGFVPSKSAYYLVDKGNIINLSITASKTISVTDKFSFPINVSYISNPSQDKTYLVFGASFVF